MKSLEHLSTTPIEVLMTLGAGDIATLVNPIQRHLQKTFVKGQSLKM